MAWVACSPSSPIDHAPTMHQRTSLKLLRNCFVSPWILLSAICVFVIHALAKTFGSTHWTRSVARGCCSSQVQHRTGIRGRGRRGADPARGGGEAHPAPHQWQLRRRCFWYVRTHSKLIALGLSCRRRLSDRRVPFAREDVPDAGPAHRRGHRARRRGRQRGHRPRRGRRPQGLRRGPVAEDDRLRTYARAAAAPGRRCLHVGR